MRSKNALRLLSQRVTNQVPADTLLQEAPVEARVFLMPRARQNYYALPAAP
jgi:hypothetical protein